MTVHLRLSRIRALALALAEEHPPLAHRAGRLARLGHLLTAIPPHLVSPGDLAIVHREARPLVSLCPELHAELEALYHGF